MDCVQWRSTTYGRNGKVAHSKNGFRDLVEERRMAKAKEIRDRKKQSVACLKEYGVDKLYSRYNPEGLDDEEQKDEGQNGEAQKEVEQVDLVAKKQQLRYKFFQKGLERRKLATEKNRRFENFRAKNREENLKKNRDTIFQKEYGTEIRAQVRNDRIMMKKADEESQLFEKERNLGIIRKANFEKARAFMEDQMLNHGFVPNQGHTRRAYFAKQGLKKKAQKLKTQ